MDEIEALQEQLKKAEWQVNYYKRELEHWEHILCATNALLTSKAIQKGEANAENE